LLEDNEIDQTYIDEVEQTYKDLWLGFLDEEPPFKECI